LFRRSAQKVFVARQLRNHLLRMRVTRLSRGTQSGEAAVAITRPVEIEREFKNESGSPVVAANARCRPASQTFRATPHDPRK
jgi:hypothetical protein